MSSMLCQPLGDGRDRGPAPPILARVPILLAAAVAATALALAVWAAWRAITDRPVILRQLLAGAVVEALLLAEVVVAVVLVAQGRGTDDVATFWGYLITSLVLLPVAAAWAFAERTRWSSVVLLVATVTVAFLQLRLVQVWAGG